MFAYVTAAMMTSDPVMRPWDQASRTNAAGSSSGRWTILLERVKRSVWAIFRPRIMKSWSYFARDGEKKATRGDAGTLVLSPHWNIYG